MSNPLQPELDALLAKAGAHENIVSAIASLRDAAAQLQKRVTDLEAQYAARSAHAWDKGGKTHEEQEKVTVASELKLVGEGSFPTEETKQRVMERDTAGPSFEQVFNRPKITSPVGTVDPEHEKIPTESSLKTSEQSDVSELQLTGPSPSRAEKRVQVQGWLEASAVGTVEQAPESDMEIDARQSDYEAGDEMSTAEDTSGKDD